MYDLGGVLRRLGRPGRAIPHLERAAALAPTDADVQVELGLALMALGRNTEARDCLERAIALDPSRPESRVHLPELIRQLADGG